MYYYTKIYLGSKLQELKVAFSTLSTISVINSKDCTGAIENTGFDFVNSFSIHKVTTQHLKYLIGTFMAQGLLV